MPTLLPRTAPAFEVMCLLHMPARIILANVFYRCMERQSQVSCSSLWAQCEQIILQMCTSGAWDRSSRLAAIILLYFACQYVFHSLSCGLYSSVRYSYQVCGLHPPLLWKFSSFLIMLATGAPGLTGVSAVFANTLAFIVISVCVQFGVY